MINQRLPPPKQTHLQVHCLPHSAALSSSAHVTIAIRSLHCSPPPYPHYHKADSFNGTKEEKKNEHHRMREDVNGRKQNAQRCASSCIVGITSPSSSSSCSPFHHTPLYDGATLSPNTNSSSDLVDGSNNYNNEEEEVDSSYERHGKQYRVTVTLMGVGGIPLHSTPFSTVSSSILLPTLMRTSDEAPKCPAMTSTYSCTWDNASDDHYNVLTLPFRWKDLSRDAFFDIKVLGSGGDLVARATMDLWDGHVERNSTGARNVAACGAKLKTGLHRLRLSAPSDYSSTEEKDNNFEDDDEKWDASLILDHLDQLQTIQSNVSVGNNVITPSTAPVSVNKASTNSSWASGGKHARNKILTSNTKYNSKISMSLSSSDTANMMANSMTVQSVPWLDKLTRERCMKILRDDGHPNYRHHQQDNDQETCVDGNIMAEQGEGIQGNNYTYSKTAKVINKRYSNFFTRHHLQSRQLRQDQYNQPHERRKDSSDNHAYAAYLIVELPSSSPNFSIVYEEMLYPTELQGSSGSVTALDLSLYQKRIVGSALLQNDGQSQLQYQQQFSLRIPMPNPLLNNSNNDYSNRTGLAQVQVLDHECEDDNPVEDKYRTLQHDLLRGLVDPALKPDREQRARLNAIIGSTSQHLSREEMDLLWRFRFSLVDNRRALTKFLLAVEWTEESEVIQAAELLEQWRKRSPIEVTDALRLLGKNVAFQTDLVRTYAIDTLAAAPDGELVLYLLQLVQALKYESIENNTSSASVEGHSRSVSGSTFQAGKDRSSVSSLGSFLIERASKNIELANYLYWYLKVELEDPTYGLRYQNVFAAFQEKLSRTPYLDEKKGEPSNICEDKDDHQKVHDQKHSPFVSVLDSVSRLGTSLSEAAHLTSTNNKIFKGRSMWDVLLAQDAFINGIMNCQKASRDVRGKKDAKEQHLRETLKSEGFHKIRNREAVPLPSAPHIMVNGIKPESVRMFKSALYPVVIEFSTENLDLSSSPIVVEDILKDGEKTSKQSENNASTSVPHETSSANSTTISTYKVFMKTGDDLRQDQLVIMMIKLMDGILKRGTLDLCLKPYSIMATSQTSGLMEFVGGSIPISQILTSYNNSIMQFFQNVAPCEGSRYSVHPEVMQRYIRSCAGYCVITYLLGVGDRHLDNIMLLPSGHFFHIDFGFIFGRDPKPLPPAFRLTREMVDGMGGQESMEYRQFCSLACQAFNLLRKSAGLILNLLHLMSDAGIEDLSNNPSGDADGVITKVEERFRLELTDEQAEGYFLGLINDCLMAIAPRVMDVFHQIAVARR